MKDYQQKTLQAYEDGVDKYQTSTSEMFWVTELEKFLSLAPKKPGNLLDVGCAFGKDTAFLQSKGREAIGVDLSEAFIERAKKVYPNLEFKQMDVLSLDFPDQTFSAIWSNAVLHHLKDDDVTTALMEFYRVLTEGGIFAASFKKGKGSEEIIEKFSSDGKRFYQYQTEGSIKRLVELTGFEVFEIYSLNVRKVFGSKYSDLDWIWIFAKKVT